MSDETTFTDRAVYIVMEHNKRGEDSPVLIFEDDAETLRDAMEYCSRLADGDSQICTGDFHAASPGFPHMDGGDWYLTKRHGVGISHGLAPGVEDV